jgi:hypothetical protein
MSDKNNRARSLQPARELELSEREQRWTREFASEGVRLVRSPHSTAPASPRASTQPARDSVKR